MKNCLDYRGAVQMEISQFQKENKGCLIALGVLFLAILIGGLWCGGCFECERGISYEEQMRIEKEVAKMELRKQREREKQQEAAEWRALKAAAKALEEEGRQGK